MYPLSVDGDKKIRYEWTKEEIELALDEIDKDEDKMDNLERNVKTYYETYIISLKPIFQYYYQSIYYYLFPGRQIYSWDLARP